MSSSREDDSATVDPGRPSSRGASPAGEVAFVEIAFHPDLRLVGARALVSARSSMLGEAIVIGRDEPVFARDDASEVGPLADPCVSRRQLKLRWLAHEGRFAIEPLPGARREVALFDADGSAYQGPIDAIPPGTLVAIGDRALLALDCGAIPRPPLGLVGGGRTLAELRHTIATLAHARSSVLLVGETGTGKELVARALHDAGPRRCKPFIAVNCAAIPDTLFEAELFGVVKGAFSGATMSRDGLLRTAGDGTIFLDEIGELSLAAQAKLLRVLQEKYVRPVGASEEHPLEARIVMATNRDLEAEVEQGRFRADLFARIEAPRIDVVPIRERREDIPRLFVHFLESRLADDARPLATTPFRPATADPPLISMASFVRMMRHDWPRNAREIEKVATRVALELRTRGAVDDGVFPQSKPSPASAVASRRTPPTTEELLALLDEHDYVQNRLAKALAISRTTLDKWMREAGVRRPSEVSRDELVAALTLHGGDMRAAARELRVSVRGLRLHATELQIG